MLKCDLSWVKADVSMCALVFACTVMRVTILGTLCRIKTKKSDSQKLYDIVRMNLFCRFVKLIGFHFHFYFYFRTLLFRQFLNQTFNFTLQLLVIYLVNSSCNYNKLISRVSMQMNIVSSVEFQIKLELIRKDRKCRIQNSKSRLILASKFDPST